MPLEKTNRIKLPLVHKWESLGTVRVAGWLLLPLSNTMKWSNLELADSVLTGKSIRRLDPSRTTWNSLMATNNPRILTMPKTHMSWLPIMSESSATRIKIDLAILYTRPRGSNRGSQAEICEKIRAKHGTQRITLTTICPSLAQLWRCLHPDQCSRGWARHTRKHSQ